MLLLIIMIIEIGFSLNLKYLALLFSIILSALEFGVVCVYRECVYDAMKMRCSLMLGN